MNGMSGGAVFHIGEDSDGFFVGLAGLIQRGGDNSDRFSFIDTEFLHRFATT